MAAIAAAREGARVVLLEQTRHVGGMSTSGLNRDESEHMHRNETFGGLADRFIHTASSRSGYKGKGRPYIWLPHVAEQVFNEMLADAKVPVRFEQLLSGAHVEHGHIATLSVRGGETYHAKVFVDATYEGDLMAAAGVRFVLGRESAAEFGESMAGVIYDDAPINVSPYDKNGRLLPGIMSAAPPPRGGASPHPVGCNIRLNLNTGKDRIPITRPDDYDPMKYELLARCIQARLIRKLSAVLGLYGLPNSRVECNNTQAGLVSMNMPGEQTAWPEATFEQRRAIQRQFQSYTAGLLWFLQSDPRVPESWRRQMARYGLCKDEWTDNGHWPWYLYIREARRMRGVYVLTQNDITRERTKPDVICLASHYIDSHHTARYAVDHDHFINEGRLWKPGQIYAIPYRSITPKQAQCDNLLVPVCVSASHVAFCTIRLEPTWMQLGEASGIAAAMAARAGEPVQAVDVAKLQAHLRDAGIPLAPNHR